MEILYSIGKHHGKLVILLCLACFIWQYPRVLIILFLLQFCKDLYVKYNFKEFRVPFVIGICTLCLVIYLVFVTKDITPKPYIPFLTTCLSIGVAIVVFLPEILAVLAVPCLGMILAIFELLDRFNDSKVRKLTEFLFYQRVCVDIFFSIAICVAYGVVAFFNSTSIEGSDLRQAARNSDVQAVRRLLVRGVDPDSKDNYSVTALQIAAQHAQQEITELLLECGACVNHQDSYGFTALHWAVQVRREETSESNRMHVVRILLRSGADINVCDVNGNTPLSIASREGNSTSLEILMEEELYDSNSD